ncbi:hypothetical protein FGO68_gene14265 [Halteria grandinella]|uniref:Uncharacterized protein n=1 Tax=Halteria grandinella TaxID=5974 RepID=A0A8J8NNR6_HALGN|nr:hypothetical protein FGO68_gene14265 [Halteria grandinella]
MSMQFPLTDATSISNATTNVTEDPLENRHQRKRELLRGLFEKSKPTIQSIFRKIHRYILDAKSSQRSYFATQLMTLFNNYELNMIFGFFGEKKTYNRGRVSCKDMTLYQKVCNSCTHQDLQRVLSLEIVREIIMLAMPQLLRDYATKGKVILRLRMLLEVIAMF